MPKPTLLLTETPGGALELREQAQLSLGFCFYSDPPAYSCAGLALGALFVHIRVGVPRGECFLLSQRVPPSGNILPTR